jgi:lysophospholipase L1-like esterase
MRKNLMKVGVSTASLLFTLLALEIGLRLGGYEPLGDWESGKEYVIRPSAYPELKYELSPGTSGVFSNTDVQINSEGFRGPEPASNPGQRVIILGDSIAFGNSLPAADTVASQLQQRLNAARQDVEVLNFGVGSYDILQEVSLLEIRGLKYHPKLVVVVYCLNDISVSSMSPEQIEWRRSKKSFLYKSRLVQFVVSSIEKIKVERWVRRMNQPEVFHREYENQIDAIGNDETELLDLMKDAPKKPNPTYYGDRDRVGRLRFSFRKLASSSKEHGFRVVIMVVPLLMRTSDTYSHRAAHRIVQLEAERAGFDTIDLTEPFMRAGMNNLTSELGDIIHPNKVGHAIMADELLNYFVSHPAGKPPQK